MMESGDFDGIEVVVFGGVKVRKVKKRTAGK
jgi:hypothetical protein